MTSPQKSDVEQLGRIVIITGDKGGTGKSVVARMLLDIYRDRKYNCIAYDCDESNPQLYRHYHKLAPGVRTLKLNRRGGADALQDDLKQFSPRVSLVDLPAGAAEYFRSISQDISLFYNAERFGYKVTMISVLNRQKDSISQLKKLVEFCGDKVDYVIVKNLYWGEEYKFTRYNNSKTRKAVQKLGAVELEFPELFDDIFDLVDEGDLTFREAIDSERLTISNQSRIFNWVENCEVELQKAGEYLGL